MRNELKVLLKENPNSITEAVITEALSDTYDEPKDFFKLLFEYGCQSWMVSSMIYYVDTHKFYDKHYNEIEDIRFELQDLWIENNNIDSDLKNYYAWLSFEHVAFKIYDQLGE